MFTLQTGVFDRLKDAGMPAQWADILREGLANCTQSIEHRGTVTVTESIQGTFQWGKAISNWVNIVGNGSYVDCNICEDKDGLSVTGPVVRVYLPRPNQSLMVGALGGHDPNVRAGAVIAFSKDKKGVACCISDYLDAKIGTLWKWNLDVSLIPPGWRKCTHVGGTSLLGDGGYTRFLAPQHDDATNMLTLGQAGGGFEHSHESHQISAHVVNPATSTGTVGLGGGGGGTAFTSFNPETTVLFTTDCAKTGITIPPHSEHAHGITSVTTAVTNLGTGSGNVECIDVCTTTATLGCGPVDIRNHTVIEPGCAGTDSCGTGSGSGGSGSGGEGGGHQHTGCVVIPTHRHSVDLTILAHTHSLTMNPHSHSVDNHDDLEHVAENHQNQYVTAYLIERFE